MCIVHPRGPSKSPFSELANVLNSLTAKWKSIAHTLIGVCKSRNLGSLHYVQEKLNACIHAGFTNHKTKHPILQGVP